MSRPGSFHMRFGGWVERFDEQTGEGRAITLGQPRRLVEQFF